MAKNTAYVQPRPLVLSQPFSYPDPTQSEKGDSFDIRIAELRQLESKTIRFEKKAKKSRRRRSSTSSSTSTVNRQTTSTKQTTASQQLYKKPQYPVSTALYHTSSVPAMGHSHPCSPRRRSRGISSASSSTSLPCKAASCGSVVSCTSLPPACDADLHDSPPSSTPGPEGDTLQSTLVHQGGAAPAPVHQGGASPSSAHQGGASPSPVHQGGAAPAPVHQGGASPSPVYQGGAAPAPVHQGGASPSPVYQGGAAPAPVHQGGASPSPVHQDGASPSPVYQGGAAPAPVHQGGASPSPVHQDGASPSPVYQGGAAPAPVHQGGASPSPVYQGGAAPAPVHQDGASPSPVHQGGAVPAPVHQGGKLSGLSNAHQSDLKDTPPLPQSTTSAPTLCQTAHTRGDRLTAAKSPVTVSKTDTRGSRHRQSCPSSTSFTKWKDTKPLLVFTSIIGPCTPQSRKDSGHLRSHSSCRK